MSFCAAIAYAAVYLQGLGYSNAELGLIIAAGNLLGSLLGPGLSSVIDRSPKVNASMLVMPLLLIQAVTEILLAAFPVKSAVLPLIYVLYIAACLTANSLYLKQYSDAVYQGRFIDYGFARGMGSAAYVAATPMLGNLVKYTGVRAIPLLGLAFTGFQLLSFLAIRKQIGPEEENAENAAAGNAPAENAASGNAPAENAASGNAPAENAATGNASAENAEGSPENAAAAGAGNGSTERAENNTSGTGKTMGEFIRTNPRFFVLLLGTAILFFSHNTINTFMINVVRNVGGDTATMGVFDGLLAAVEIPVMMFYTTLFRKKNCRSLLCAAFLFFIMKAAAVAAAHTVPLLLVSAILQAPSFALYTSAIVPYVAEEIAYEDSAKAQSLAYTMTTCGAVLASLISGKLYDIWPVTPVLWFGCGVSIAGAAIAIAGLKKKKKTEKA